MEVALPLLQEAMKSAGEWITVVRKTRNGMFHGGERARVLMPMREDEILFHIVMLRRGGPLSAELDRTFYSKETPTYLKFNLVSSVILARTLELANLIASLCKKKMEQRMQVKKPNVQFSVTIPDMSVPIYWLSLARCQLAANQNSFTPSVGFTPQKTSMITKQTMLGFIDVVLSTNSQLSHRNQIKPQVVRIEALIRRLSSKNLPFHASDSGELSFLPSERSV